MSVVIRIKNDVDAGALAHQALDKIVADFRRPAFRAGLGAAVLSTAMFARARMRPGPAIIMAVMIGASVEHLYGMAEDIHDAALMKLDSIDAPGKI